MIKIFGYFETRKATTETANMKQMFYLSYSLLLHFVLYMSHIFEHALRVLRN